MKKEEKDMVDKISTYTNSKFTISEYVYERYDASNTTHLLEVKDRGNIPYDDLIIEFDKFAYNRAYSIITNRGFWYSSRVNNEIYIWDISALIKINYNFDWQWCDLPSNTEWGGNTIKKYAGKVWKEDAIIAFKSDTLEKITKKES